jgi:hypothetical protein
MYYWFKLRRCDMDPSDPSNVYWTSHSYVYNTMTYGDLFKSGGGYYYTVVDHATSDQGGTIDGSITQDYPDCNSVPGHWVAPTPLPGQSVGAITGTTYNSSTEACNNYQSGFEGNLWLSGTSTPDVGLFFFTGQDCGTTFTGNSNWYYVFRGATEYAIRIGGTGYISEVVTCGVTPPSPSPSPSPAPATTATLSWTFSINNSPSSPYMYIYVNGSIIESRSYDSSGNFSVNVGDQIYVDLGASGCSGFNSTANTYTGGIISDASSGTGTSTLSTYTYTVTSGDLGNVLNLNCYANCDSGSV